VVKVEESGPTFVVSGIVYSKDAPSSVVVDGRLLHEGDTVLGLTIERIGEDEVIFVKDGKRWILKVGQKSP
jgi:type II secretory pathway component PulC